MYFDVISIDSIELFNLTSFILGILINSMDANSFQWLFMMGLSILMIEMLVDWIKHSFVTKFNSFDASLFAKFRDDLCDEYLIHRSQNNGDQLVAMKIGLFHLIDKSHGIAQKMGFVSLPPAVLVSCSHSSPFEMC